MVTATGRERIGFPAYGGNETVSGPSVPACGPACAPQAVSSAPFRTGGAVRHDGPMTHAPADLRQPSARPETAVLAAFEAARGFMPTDEGLALYQAAVEAAGLGLPLLEVGTYCGRSTILLAAAARDAGVDALTVDHHRGSEEQQPGWEYHDPSLVDGDPRVGLIDTLPEFRRTLHAAGLEDRVIALVGRSPRIAALWGRPLGLVFVDGGHTDEHATGDYEGWAPHVAPGGLLVIHDVFPDPADGGQAPYRIHQRALASGAFTEVSVTRSLRVLRRTAPGI